MVSEVSDITENGQHLAEEKKITNTLVNFGSLLMRGKRLLRNLRPLHFRC